MPVNKPRRRGSYAPLSAHYYKDDKVIEAGERAELLYVRSLAFCSEVLQDGFISDGQMTRFVGAGLAGLKTRAESLVKVGLWRREDGGYAVVSWLTWNRSADEIRYANRRDSERKGGQDDD